MQLRRFILASLVLASIIQLPGCVADPVGWHDAPDHNSLPAIFRVASLDEIQRQCPKTPNADGCAVSDERRGFCWIYVPADAPKWLLAHELLHCSGYSHD